MSRFVRRVSVDYGLKRNRIVDEHEAYSKSKCRLLAFLNIGQQSCVQRRRSTVSEVSEVLFLIVRQSKTMHAKISALPPVEKCMLRFDFRVRTTIIVSPVVSSFLD